MMSPKALEETDRVSQNPVGTGRYIYEGWTPGEKLTINSNPEYWGGAPEITSITFKPVVENGTRISMLQSGDADFIFPVPTEHIEALKNNSDITVTTIPSIITRYITMNTAKPPFDDVRVRQALNYAINKDAYCQVVYNGFADQQFLINWTNVQFYKAQEPYTLNIGKS